MIDDNHNPPVVRHPHHKGIFQLINLYYFFQIVKEQKQPMIEKRSNLNHVTVIAITIALVMT